MVSPLFNNSTRTWSLAPGRCMAFYAIGPLDVDGHGVIPNPMSIQLEVNEVLAISNGQPSIKWL